MQDTFHCFMNAMPSQNQKPPIVQTSELRMTRDFQLRPHPTCYAKQTCGSRSSSRKLGYQSALMGSQCEASLVIQSTELPEPNCMQQICSHYEAKDAGSITVHSPCAFPISGCILLLKLELYCVILCPYITF